MDTPMDITIMARDLLKLSLKLRLKLNPTMDILVDMDILTLVDITTERDLLKLSQKQLLLLKPILKLIPGMDTMVDTMDILTTDMDIGAERRGKLSLKLRPRLNPTMDILVDMDILTLVDITMERDLLKLSQKQLLLLKLILKLIPGMDTMVVTMVILIMDMDT